MSGDQIQLRGLRLVVSIGALPEEHERAQPIELDVDVDADLSVAGASDELGDTINYAALCAAAASVFDRHIVLLEAAADRVAAAVRAVDPRITGVTVVARKLRPPVPWDLATSAVRVVR